MNRKVKSIESLNSVAVALMLILSYSLLLAPAPGLSSAKRGGSDDRARFYGIVESRSVDGAHGDRVIGGRLVTTDSRTPFDQTEGPLTIGHCAKVDFRHGRVLEIDSEPLRDCQ
jgi:hypothetical protein